MAYDYLHGETVRVKHHQGLIVLLIGNIYAEGHGLQCMVDSPIGLIVGAAQAAQGCKAYFIDGGARQNIVELAGEQLLPCFVHRQSSRSIRQYRENIGRNQRMFRCAIGFLNLTVDTVTTGRVMLQLPAPNGQLLSFGSYGIKVGSGMAEGQLAVFRQLHMLQKIADIGNGGTAAVITHAIEADEMAAVFRVAIHCIL